MDDDMKLVTDDQLDYKQLVHARRKRVKEYIAGIPDECIDLSQRLVAKNKSDNVIVNDYLAGNVNDISCEAVGCVFGWLTTMPEIREFHRNLYDLDSEKGVPVTALTIYRFLGVLPDPVPLGDIFAPRLRPDIPQKQEAMQRMELLQQLPIEKWD